MAPDHINGATICNVSGCTLIVTEDWDATSMSDAEELESRMTLTGDGKVTGHVTLTDMTASCTETGDIAGTRKAP